MPTLPLRSRLAESASHHATRALEAYREASHRDFYLHAGTALELAIKARLVGEHGLHCLAPDTKGWFDAALAIGRDVDGTAQKRPRTVDAGEALRRLRLVEPELPDVFGRHVSDTLDRRNIGAHVGQGAAPPAEDFLSHAAAFVRAVGVLLRSNTEAFWGELAGLAASLVNDELNAVAVRVQAKIAQARAALRLLTANGTNEVGSALAAAAELALHEEEPDVINLPCPVCRFDGWGVGAVVDEGDAEGEHDDGGITWHWLPDLYVLLDSFECHVCRLNLEGAEELDEAGVPLRVATDRATPGDALDAVRTNEAYYLS